ncbi:MAG TPA: LuxR C-terminal-related transcriptional regulator [Solirubrobacteraceae bacterium]|nr:LuxR C-terminal-related transcriptional regulator [Solirubrobacteraceae bacterium]
MASRPDTALLGPQPSAAAATAVPRLGLIGRLRAMPDGHVALLVAPSGYGKTTLLTEWTAIDGRPAAWVRLRDEDNDVGVLLRHLATALAAVGADPGPPSRGLQGLGHAVGWAAQSFVLVLDDLQVLAAPEALEAITLLVEYLEPGSRLALATSREPRLPLGRLRAHRRLLEIGPEDLALSRAESEALLRHAGVTADRAACDAVTGRAEGWAAGVSLAAVALRGGATAASFTGEDRVVADYLQEVFLEELSPAAMRFLLRTSVLDELSGPLCDAVLEEEGSGAMLRRLSRSDLLLAPIDRCDQRFRRHGLLTSMLRAELRRREPAVEASLHRRASAAYEAYGDLDRGLHHAIAAHDGPRAGRLLWRSAPEHIGRGDHAAVERWLRGFSEADVASSAPLALSAGLAHLVQGTGALVERWTDAAAGVLESGDAAGPEGDLRAAVATLRSALAVGGVGRMLDDALRAEALGFTDPSWCALGRLLEGTARHLLGDRDGARAPLEEAVRRGAAQAPVIQVQALAQLALLAVERDDWATAETFSARAMRQVGRASLAGLPATALPHAVAALVEAHRGRVAEGKASSSQAVELVASLSDFAPWYCTEVRIVLAWAAVRLGDAAGARSVLGEAEREHARAPDSPVLAAWLKDAAGRARGAEGGALLLREPLTTAELRLLQFLPTHRSFPAVAAELVVSPNTVKSQARAVYRKLGVSSRSGAVQRARALGLVDSA